ncbi:hypothetical protein AC579_9166 [Pseudocercospora musae]|uniref:Uncharacterized protein n=1 Tax=Pseudocercospora musae TaxID=113226 RepID=A0A139GT15_9PEZI|nr:hypothetical protein AC579_9166 [Pseudocercospora musae]
MADLLGGALSAVVGLEGVDGDQPTATATTPVEPIVPATPPPPTAGNTGAPKQDPTLQPTATSSIVPQIAIPSSQTLPGIVTVTREPIVTSAATSVPDQTNSSNTGAIAAGVIACFAAVGIIIAIILWRWRRKHTPENFQQLDETSSIFHAGASTRKGILPYSSDSVYPVEKLELQPVLHEMPDTSTRAEMDGGQMYHAYKLPLGQMADENNRD